MTTTTCDTPEDPQEKRLSLKGLQLALADKLQNGRPDHKTLYRWLARPLPMPSKPNPGGGKGRSYLLSHVLAWLDDPHAYYRKQRKAS